MMKRSERIYLEKDWFLIDNFGLKIISMKIVCVLLLFLSLFACNTTIERIPKPENLIPRDSMVIILQDLTVLESHITNKYPAVNSFQELMKTSGDSLLAKYHVTYKRLDESMSYYGSRQEEMQSIYTEVQDSLTWKMNHL